MAQIFFNKSGRRPSAFATLGLIVMVLAAISLLVAWPVLGYLQKDYADPALLFDWRLKVLAVTQALVALGAVLTFMGILHGRMSIRVRMSYRVFLAIFIGALAAAPPVLLHWQQSNHPLHDISTDIGDPPHFELLAERAYDTDSEDAMAGGRLDFKYEDTHRAIYPAIKSIRVALTAEQALAAAGDAFETLGWSKANGILARNQIEATYENKRLFLLSRIVVRVRFNAAASASTLDFRALSPVGVSDYGMGEKSFQAFKRAFESAVAHRAE